MKKTATENTPARPNTAMHFVAGFAIGGLFVSALWKGLWWLELLCLGAFLAYILFSGGFARRYRERLTKR